MWGQEIGMSAEQAEGVTTALLAFVLARGIHDAGLGIGKK